MAVNTPSGRSRGRPARTPEQHEQMRARILAAAGAVYAKHGQRGTTVARIVKKAHLSRPTFYVFFDGTDDVITALVNHTQSQLNGRLYAVIAEPADLITQIVAAVDVYLDTTEEMGDAARVFHIEAHDPASSAHRLRQENEEVMVEMLRGRIIESGRPAPSSEAFRMLFGTLQAGSYRYLSTPGSDRREARAAMLRAAVALVGAPEDWRRAAERPDRFGQ